MDEERRHADIATRVECYRRINECVKAGLAGYYQEYPDRLFDARSTLAIQHSLIGLKKLFDILDEYEITHLRKET